LAGVEVFDRVDDAVVIVVGLATAQPTGGVEVLEEIGFPVVIEVGDSADLVVLFVEDALDIRLAVVGCIEQLHPVPRLVAALVLDGLGATPTREPGAGDAAELRFSATSAGRCAGDGADREPLDRRSRSAAPTVHRNRAPSASVAVTRQ